MKLLQIDMLILENRIVLEELEMECQEKINEDMAYALSYIGIYNQQLDVVKLHREMNNLMVIYGLSDMVYRGITLVKYYAPNESELSEILHSCFCSSYAKADVEVQQELGIGRTSFWNIPSANGSVPEINIHAGGRSLADIVTKKLMSRVIDVNRNPMKKNGNK